MYVVREGGRRKKLYIRREIDELEDFNVAIFTPSVQLNQALLQAPPQATPQALLAPQWKVSSVYYIVTMSPLQVLVGVLCTSHFN